MSKSIQAFLSVINTFFHHLINCCLVLSVNAKSPLVAHNQYGGYKRIKHSGVNWWPVGCNCWILRVQFRLRDTKNIRCNACNKGSPGKTNTWIHQQLSRWDSMDCWLIFSLFTACAVFKMTLIFGCFVSGPLLHQLWPVRCRPQQSGGGVLRLGSGVLRRLDNSRPRATSCWVFFFFFWLFLSKQRRENCQVKLSPVICISTVAQQRRRESEKYSSEILCCHREKQILWAAKRKKKGRSEEMLGENCCSTEILLKDL